MRRVAVLALVLATGCAHGLFSRGPKPNVAVEAQYTRALGHLDPANTASSIDTAIAFLDAYLAYAGYTERRTEATALRRLAGEARQLMRVQAALQEARASAGERARSSDTASAQADEDLVREIQRLRDELAKANAELERIKKRLATPKP